MQRGTDGNTAGDYTPKDAEVGTVTLSQGMMAGSLGDIVLGRYTNQASGADYYLDGFLDDVLIRRGGL